MRATPDARGRPLRRRKKEVEERLQEAAERAATLDVFQLTGTVAIAAYTLALIPESNWMWRPWRMTAKSICDSIVYGLLTGAVFAWLWPHG